MSSVAFQGSAYKRANHRIYGGLEYMQKRPQVKPRYLDFQYGDMDADDIADRAKVLAKLRKVHELQALVRESSRLFQKADANGDGADDIIE